MTKVLALTSAGLGHLFPMVPSLWAARLAGGSVLVGATGPAVGAAVEAGLAAVDLNPRADGKPAEVRGSFLRRMPGRSADERFTLAMELFAALSDLVVDAAVEVGEHWRPDIVMHTPLQPAGAIVAAALGVPAIEHGFQLTGVERTQHLLAPHLADACDRHHVRLPEKAAVALDLCPPSLRTGRPRGRPLGYRPFNGGRRLDPALLHRADQRPRIMITLGSTDDHDAQLPTLIAALHGRGLDLVVGGHPSGELPPDVIATGWLPLDAVLATCDGLVHHGGSGSALTALAAGVPQVIISGHADHAFNAAALTRRGAGCSAIPEADGYDAVRGAVEHIVRDPGPRTAARQVAAEMAAQAGPDAVIPSLLDELVNGLDTGSDVA